MALLRALLGTRIETGISRPSTTINKKYSKFTKIMEYKRCYKILEIPEDCDQDKIRNAYLKLVKRYHPDSGTPEGDANKFSEIDKAFRMLMKKSTERSETDPTVLEQDIRHIAPQHRQYLSYEGVGVGTPFQRQKHFTKMRAVQAAENVLKHRISKISAEEGALLKKSTPHKHNIKTKYGLERLVEDLIQESISRGEFNNLAGSGKPLPNHHNQNPYVDFVTHKLNEVLIDNGFTPEWITLQKEIREETELLRSSLATDRSYLGPIPLNFEDSSTWSNVVSKHEKLIQQINKKIAKFNLIVPIMDKQMMQVNLEKECAKILASGLHSQPRTVHENNSAENIPTDTMNIFSLIEVLFKSSRK